MFKKKSKDILKYNKIDFLKLFQGTMSVWLLSDSYKSAACFGSENIKLKWKHLVFDYESEILQSLFDDKISKVFQF